MKTLTCRDLGGPCDELIAGESFQEIAGKCHAHVMELINNGDEAHQAAAGAMRNASPEQQAAMMSEYEARFNAAPVT